MPRGRVRQHQSRGGETSPAGSTSPLIGLAVCAGAAGISLAVSRLIPAASALLVAILLGVVVGNLMTVPESWRAGTAIAAKQLLRAGIIALGFKISLSTVVALGWPAILLVLAIVGLGIVGSYWIGRALGLDDDLAMLIAGGFSICGAAAVAALDGVIRPAKEHVATAIGLVVLYGSAMIAVVPAVSRAVGLDAEVTALWAGGGTHEVAQVVAIGGILGGGGLLATAVIVKLARVVLLAPVLVGVGLWSRRRGATVGQRPPLVPAFVAGFLAAMVLRTVVPLPGWFLHGAEIAQVVLLSMAMFALGLGVTRAALARTSPRALGLGALSTLLVNALAFAGAWLIAAH